MRRNYFYLYIDITNMVLDFEFRLKEVDDKSSAEKMKLEGTINWLKEENASYDSKWFEKDGP